MIRNVVQRIEHSGDPSLSVRAVGLIERILRHDHRRQARVHGQRSANARDPAADHQHIRKDMWNSLRIKAD